MEGKEEEKERRAHQLCARIFYLVLQLVRSVSRISAGEDKPRTLGGEDDRRVVERVGREAADNVSLEETGAPDQAVGEALGEEAEFEAARGERERSARLFRRESRERRKGTRFRPKLESSPQRLAGQSIHHGCRIVLELLRARPDCTGRERKR